VTNRENHSFIIRWYSVRRIVFALILLLPVVVILDGSVPSGIAVGGSYGTIGNLKLYTFSPDDKFHLGFAQPLILPPGTTVEEALLTLGKSLEENYFLKTYSKELISIFFELLAIHQIPTPSRSLRLAVINMIDKDLQAMGSFFQGSTSAQTTFYMLGATFMQPQLNPPLLDGMAVLYNGQMAPRLDHIDLSGILIPKQFARAAKGAILRTEREAEITPRQKAQLASLTDHSRTPLRF
jgi:hypothetical protein